MLKNFKLEFRSKIFFGNCIFLRGLYDRLKSLYVRRKCVRCWKFKTIIVRRSFEFDTYLKDECNPKKTETVSKQIMV